MSCNGLRKGLLAAVSASVICGLSAAQAQSDILLNKAETNIVGDAAALRLSKRDTSEDSLRAFLQLRGKNADTIASLETTSLHNGAGGKRFARFEQRIGGLRVHGAFARAAFDDKGDMIHVMERLAPAGRRVSRIRMKEAEALEIALKLNFPGASVPALENKSGVTATFAYNSFFYSSPKVERVIIARGDTLEEGYLVEIWRDVDNMLYHTLVNGLGEVVENELRTAEDSYNIYADHPGVSPQTIVQGPGSGNAQSPSGWLSGSQTSLVIQGNNARAYLDRNNNNSPDGGGVSITNGNFTTSSNFSQQPTTTQNQEVAVQNLFYFNNLIHDELYRHGFVEGTGNFQENNFGNGGAGSDSVNAEAQDGGGANNANFATPSDGSNPRMQMFLWTFTNPQRDGDLDSDIIWHEYGHGLTWRMIGSMSGNVPGALGEGMSDVLAIIQNDDDAVGEYSFANAGGIRSSIYSQHQDTIGDFNSSRGVHRNGEIIAATVWDMWTAYKAAGLTRDDIMGDIVSGMNFIAPAPDYFDMRDGFLAQAPSSRDCLIWEAFAARGMGVGGSMNSSGTSINESFSVPSECSGGGDPDPDPDAGPELTNLTAFAQRESRSRWRATVTVTVGDGNGGAGAGVVASIVTNTGAAGSCTTNSAGQCSATLSRISRRRTRSVTFTITALDGDTNATGVPASVTVNRP
ncbi:MAG: M36 family metallopeptidase [Pseudomonadota bacterium]